MAKITSEFKIYGDADLRRQVKSGELSGAYLLFGEEDYLKSYYVGLIKAAVSQDPVFSVFNEVEIAPADLTPFALESALMAMPMGADKKIITVKNFSFNGAKPTYIDELIETVSLIEELSHNVLVIAASADGLDVGRLPSRPSALLKKLGAHMTLVQFPEQTPARLVAWAQKHFEHFGVKADASLCNYLISRCGRSMYILSSEIEKLSFFTLYNGKDTATREDADRVTVPELDCDTFALTNAVISGDRAAAIAVLEVLKFRRTEPQLILGEISSTLYSMSRVAAVMDRTGDARTIARETGIHEYRVGMLMRALNGAGTVKAGRARLERAVRLCAAADEKLKLGGRDYEPIERMLCSM